MEHWIEFPSEPTELTLAWQAPETIADRMRWAVGQLSYQGENSTFSYFSDEEFRTLNAGREKSLLRSLGYAGYPAFDLRKNGPSVFTLGVMEAFIRRLPPRSRSDFRSYLAHFRYRGQADLSPMTLLGLTEAKLPSDGFSLINRLDPMASACDLVFEVAGHRHYASTHAALSEGMALDLVSEPSNPHDPNAIRVEAEGQLIGYTNRLQSPSICSWLSHRNVSCWLMRLNGKPESPKAFVFLRMRQRSDALAA